MKDITTYIHQQLQSFYPPEEIRSMLRLILTTVCGWSYTQQICCKDKQISLNEKKQLYAIIDRLKKMEPLQYILGETEFYSIPLKVNPSVLIPRPETEELVDLIIKSDFVQSWRSAPKTGAFSAETPASLQRPVPDSDAFSAETPVLSPFRILDIGTGSGNIAIALSKHISEATVTAIDISDEALHTAEKNAQMNQVEVHFIHADILDTAKAMSLFPENFDLIVSNPPYVKQDEKNALSANVIDYEPHLALFTPDNTPLLFYNAIIDFALHKLAPDGMIFFEINPLCDMEIIDLLHKKGFTQTKLLPDLSRKNRFVSVTLIINH